MKLEKDQHRHRAARRTRADRSSTLISTVQIRVDLDDDGASPLPPSVSERRDRSRWSSGKSETQVLRWVDDSRSVDSEAV